MQVIGRAMKKMGRPERQFFFENLIGLYIDYRQTQAALMLHDALKEPDMEKAWNYIEAAMEPLERLEVEILRAERPPFEQWYRETWLRERTSSFNVHRSYLALRLFIISDGREKLLY